MIEELVHNLKTEDKTEENMLHTHVEPIDRNKINEYSYGQWDSK